MAELAFRSGSLSSEREFLSTLLYFLYVCLHILPPSQSRFNPPLYNRFSIHPNHSPEPAFAWITNTSIAKSNGFFLVLTILSAAFVIVHTFNRYLLSTYSVPDSCFTTVNKMGKTAVNWRIHMSLLVIIRRSETFNHCWLTCGWSTDHLIVPCFCFSVAKPDYIVILFVISQHKAECTIFNTIFTFLQIEIWPFPSSCHEYE